MVQRGELVASGLGFELQSWERKQRCTLQPPRLLTSSQRIGKPPLFFRWGGEDWDEGSEIVMSCMWVSELVVDFSFRFPKEPVIVPPLRLSRQTAAAILGGLQRWMPLSAGSSLRSSVSVSPL